MRMRRLPSLLYLVALLHPSRWYALSAMPPPWYKNTLPWYDLQPLWPWHSSLSSHACALLRTLPPLAGALVSPTPIALLAAAAVVIPTSHEYPSPIHSPPATFFAPHSPSTPQVAQSRHSKGQVCGEAHGRQIRREHVHRGANATVRV